MIWKMIFCVTNILFILKMTFFEGQLAFIGNITYRPTLAYPVVVRTLTHQVRDLGFAPSQAKCVQDRPEWP